MNNFYNYDKKFEQELESKVEEKLDSIKTERAEKRTVFDDEEELLLLDKFTKNLVLQTKFLQKQIYKRYRSVNSKNGSTKSTAIFFTLLENDDLMSSMYKILLNMNYIAYTSYFVKIFAKKRNISKSTVYNKINEMIYLGILEEFNNCIRITSSAISCSQNIKNFRHSEVPQDIKSHTKLYLNLIDIGYRHKDSERIKKEMGYKFTTKRAIVINEHTLLYKNKNYIDSEFFIKHSQFTKVYVLSKKLAETKGRSYDLIYLEDAIDYDKY